MAARAARRLRNHNDAYNTELLQRIFKTSDLTIAGKIAGKKINSFILRCGVNVTVASQVPLFASHDLLD